MAEKRRISVTAALIGAGGRGMDYTNYALAHPHELKIVAVAEPDPERRKRFGALHGIPDELRFSGYGELLRKPRLADAALICTQDRLHFDPAVRALEKGYQVLLEKPMATDPVECVLIGQAAEAHKSICVICHVLRYTAFFRTIKRLLDAGRIGQLISIQHNENVAYWHQALSFVRGPWNNSDTSSPMILAKSCHDMDILLWLAGADCVSVSSFGSLTHFRSENVPAGAPEYCQDGCPIEDTCPYHAPSYYLKSEFIDWAIGVDQSASVEAKLAALGKSKHGRCVYQCDNNVVDHQVVSLEFANQATAVFTMCAFTQDCNRTIKLMGTKGEIAGHSGKNEIEVRDFATRSREVIQLSSGDSDYYGHGGGDYAIMREFVSLVREGATDRVLTSASVSVQSHLMAFAAEQSRLERRTIDLAEYVEKLGQAAETRKLQREVEA